MYKDAENLIQEGLQLPPEERLHVAERLFESVKESEDNPQRREFMVEAKRRLDEYRRGKGTNFTREESMRRARRIIEQAKGRA